MTLTDLLDLYLDANLRLSRRTADTLYRGAIARLSDHLGHQATTGDLADGLVGGFIRARLDAGLSPHTVKGESAKLLALWRWAARRHLVDAWPTLTIPRPQPPQPQAWSREEISRLWRAAAGCQRPISGIPGLVIWPALLGLLWDTGERIRPVYGLRRDDIDLRARTVWLRGRKGGSPDQCRQITRETARALAALLDLVPGDPFGFADRSSIYNHFRLLLTDAGLPHGRRDKFHRIRRSHASHLHRLGGDATASLGHSSDAVTRAHYLDPEQSRKPVRLPSPLGWFRRWVG